MTEFSRQENYQFPDSNSLTSADEKYFEMVQNETNWKRKQGKLTVSNLKVKEQKIRNDEVIRIDQQGAPDSNSLTEVDREYFNIIKTEDGLSDFFKIRINPNYNLVKPAKKKINEVSQSDNYPNNDNQVLISDNHPMFKYHLVSLENNNKNKKPIVGLYLPHINKN